MERYQIIRPIGKGSFGKVYLVRHIRERRLYCLKTIALDGIAASERKSCFSEVKLLESMMHPNIVGFKEAFVANRSKRLCIVMTYCDGGDLAERLKQNCRKFFKEDQILHWFVQIALGLHFMHEMNDKSIMHRDLKTQNIFLLGNGQLVIGDLGISKVLDKSSDFTQTTIGTPYYMSPEVYKARPYNLKSDVWALGCVLYEMITLKHAFNANSLNGLKGKVIKGSFDPIPKIYSRSLAALVNKMLSVNPSARPSLAEILCMPFVRKHFQKLLTTFQTIKSDPMFERQMGNLRKQLEMLGMQNYLQQIPQPIWRGDVENASQKSNGSSPAQSSHARKNLRKVARERRNELILEKERKRAVENALNKLRKERQIRANERQQRNLNGRTRENRVRQRKEELRREEEMRRRGLMKKQREADERVRKMNELRRKPSMQNQQRPASPPPPPPPPPSSSALAVAVKQRKEELKVLEVVGGDNDDGNDVDDDGHSSFEEEMQGADSDDDDLDEKEHQLKQELEIATMRCTTIRKTLQTVRAELKTNIHHQKPETEKQIEESDEEEDEDNDDEASESSDDELFSPIAEESPREAATVPRGVGLKARIAALEEDCIRALGRKRFIAIYELLRHNLETKLNDHATNSANDEEQLTMKMTTLLAGDGKLAYWNKVDNLIFMQEAL